MSIPMFYIRCAVSVGHWQAALEFNKICVIRYDLFTANSDRNASRGSKTFWPTNAVKKSCSKIVIFYLHNYFNLENETSVKCFYLFRCYSPSQAYIWAQNYAALRGLLMRLQWFLNEVLKSQLLSRARRYIF